MNKIVHCKSCTWLQYDSKGNRYCDANVKLRSDASIIPSHPRIVKIGKSKCKDYDEYDRIIKSDYLSR